MNNKAYIFSFDKESFTTHELEILHNNLISAKGILSWWHYLPSLYIIIVQEKVSATDINNYLITIIPEKLSFICELSLRNHNGWLPPKAWEWVKNQLV